MNDEETRLTSSDAINHLDQDLSAKRPWYKKYANHILIGIGVLLVLGVVIGLILGLTLSAKPSPQGLANAVSSANIMTHLKAFYEIAMSNKGSRGVMEGYDASLDYVRRTLQAKTGCEITVDPFPAPVYYENSPPNMSYSSTTMSGSFQRNLDFLTMRYGGNGTYNLNAILSVVQNYGCQASDYGPPGTIALTFYASNSSLDCPILNKALAAQQAGAVALLVGNDQRRTALSAVRVRRTGYWAGDPLIPFPVMAVSYSTGQTLRQLASLSVTHLQLQTDTSIYIHPTNNIYCITKTGDPQKRIVIGAHLDGVPAGPGINDNGSGSASLLEIAIQFYKLKFKPVNQVMFAWWGAEELGLIGSRYFVNASKTMKPDLYQTLKAGVNFDMLASPNGFPQVQDIDYNPIYNFPETSYSGSRKITELFKTFYTNNQIPFSLTPFGGGSDYMSFAESGIPAGGLATGAGGLSSMGDRTTYGVLAQAPMDPCYHLFCDTVENIDQKLLGNMAQAGAYTTASLALEKDVVAFLASPPK